MAAETAPYGRRVEPHAHHILLAPAPFRIGLKRIEKFLHQNFRFGCGLQGVASFAGPKTIGHAFGDRCKEAAVFRFGLARRTGQAAENPGRKNTDISPPLIRSIAGNKRIIKFVLVWKREQHAAILKL